MKPNNLHETPCLSSKTKPANSFCYRNLQVLYIYFKKNGVAYQLAYDKT